MFKLQHRLMNAEPGATGGADIEKPKEKNDDVVPMPDFKSLQESNKRMEQHMKTLLDEKKQADEAAKVAKEEAAKKEFDDNKHKLTQAELEEQVNKRWEGTVNKEKEFSKSLRDRLESTEMKAAMAEVSGIFHPDYAELGSIALEKMVKVTLNENLETVREYRTLSGELITTDKEAFLEYMNTNRPEWMRGAESSKTVVEQTTISEKSNQPNGYQNLSMADKIKHLSKKG